jgi:DNA invertase Pin-like site-specific DNA recombinase
VRVALYARVSTPNGQHPEVQLAELREHAARRGWEIVREYIDQGITGARERRPELDRLWVDCRKRKVDAVLVYRYDRFARSLRQLVNALEEFRALGTLRNVPPRVGEPIRASAPKCTPFGSGVPLPADTARAR